MLRCCITHRGWRLPLFLMALSAGLCCIPAPSTLKDATPQSGPDSGADQGAGPEVRLTWDRTFGQQGELPMLLEPGAPGKLWALTSEAIYLLDAQGRVISRQALPVASSGARTLVRSARWDGQGLGLVLRWGTDLTLSAGTYLALTAADGIIKPATMIPVGPTQGNARGRWDGKAHQVLWHQLKGAAQELNLTRVPRSGTKSNRLLHSALPLDATVGGWALRKDGSLAVCTVDPGGSVSLLRFSPFSALPVVKLEDQGWIARGSCQVMDSGSSYLVTFKYRGLAPGDVDAGPGAPDLGLGSLTYDFPVVQVVDPAGKALPSAARLSTGYQGTVAVEDGQWDSARFLVLLNTAGFRGGRLVLTALDEAGLLITRDLLIPLSYEPGRLQAGRLVATATDYVLLFSSRRPADEGILHLARFTLRSLH